MSEAAADKKISALTGAPGGLLATDSFPIIRQVEGVWTNYQANLQFSDVTVQGNDFNGISELVKTDSSGNLPAIPGGTILVTNPINDEEEPLNTVLEDLHNGGAGTGTVTSASVVTANGFAGTVATATTTPAITLTTTVTGIAKGTAGGFTNAVAGDFPILNQNTTGNAATASDIAGSSTNALLYQAGDNNTAFLAASPNAVLTSNGDGAPTWVQQLPVTNFQDATSFNLTLAGWTNVGSPTATGRSVVSGQQVVVSLQIIPATSVSTTYSTSQITNLPVACGAISQTLTVLNLTSGESYSAVVLAGTTNINLPTIGVTGDTLIISGTYSTF